MLKGMESCFWIEAIGLTTPVNVMNDMSQKGLVWLPEVSSLPQPLGEAGILRRRLPSPSLSCWLA